MTGHRNHPGTRKPWTIAHENGQKCQKSRVFTMPLESCTGGHRASKSFRDPKTVDYNPRKRPEMPEITSFDDVSRVVYRGSWGVEILLGQKKPWTIAHENGQKCLKSRVFTMPLSRVTGVMGRRNPPRTQEPWTIAHEDGQKCPKSRVLTMLV